MSREIINVGTVPNDGLGDPLRTAYIKCNSNFAELYSRAQSSPPTSPIGAVGDQAGMYAYSENEFYYCFANYDGSSTIWTTISNTGTPTQLINGTTNITLAANGNISMSVAATSNVAVVSATQLSIAGAVSATGNITGQVLLVNRAEANANITAGGTIIATGNITGGNLITAGVVTATGNITGGNLSGTNIAGTLTTAAQTNVTSVGTLGSLSVTGNITGGNLRTAGLVSATGNVTGNYLFGDGSFLTNITAAANVAVSQIANGTSVISINGSGGTAAIQVAGTANVAVFQSSGAYISGLLNVTGNVDSANLRTTGLVSAAGNVTGNYILGNGALLTGVITSVANINLGTSNVTVTSSGGNVAVGIGGTPNVAVFAATGEYVTGVVSASGNITGGNLITSGLLSVTGNANVGNIGATSIVGTLTTVAQNNITSVGTLTSLSVSGNVTAGNISATTFTGALTGAATTVTANAQANITSVGTLTSLSVSGNVTAGNLSVNSGTIALGNIVNNNANGVGNIGSATTYFNTVFAQATSAQYADLAEYYEADADYPCGTVLKFGGAKELTIADLDHDPTIAGVVSTNPAYIMNSSLTGEHAVAVALMGRTMCKVRGQIHRGQMMVSAGDGFARAELNPVMGSVIGKSLVDFDGNEGEIEVLVGRM